MNKKHTQETKDKISKTLKGRRMYEMTNEIRVKISKTMKEYTRTHERISGKNHHKWQGDNISYAGIHMWVRRQKGPAKNYTCEFEDITCEGIMQWSNISHKYHRDINDFQALCLYHHIAFDKAYVQNEKDSV